MPDTVVILALAGMGVGLLVILSLRFGFAGIPQLEGNEEAVAIANGLTGGFDVTSCIMDRDRHCALLTDSLGRQAVVIPHGAHFIARFLSEGARISREASLLIVNDGAQEIELAIRSDDDFGRTAGHVGS